MQIDMIRSIKGLENAEIVRFGYAIEYDFIQPTELYHTLESKKIKGLYWAGQVNGTTGYEEAAAQGLVAGINAVLAIRKEEPFILRRDEAYIGVLIDDLVTKGTNEPYRMFTSRAEYRLLLREDNADMRLLKYAKRFGLLDREYIERVERKKHRIQKAIDMLKDSYSTPTKEFSAILEKLNEQKINDKTAWIDIIARMKEPSIEKITTLFPSLKSYTKEELEQILIESKYYRYIQKQQNQISKMQEMLSVKIPKDFDYRKVQGLSNEIVEKLERATPPTLYNALQISGITPASIEIIHIYIKMAQKSKKEIQ